MKINGVMSALHQAYKAKSLEIERDTKETWELRHKEISAQKDVSGLKRKIDALQAEMDKLDEAYKKHFKSIGSYSYELTKKANAALEKRYAEVRADVIGMSPEEAKRIVEQFVNESVWEGF